MTWLKKQWIKVLDRRIKRCKDRISTMEDWIKRDEMMMSQLFQDLDEFEFITLALELGYVDDEDIERLKKPWRKRE